VTIAAGFQCIDGIILATDLEVTENVVKRIGGKSTFKTSGGCSVAVAGAGYYEMLMYACEILTAEIVGDTLEAIVRNLREELLDIYNKHIHCSYEPHERDGVLQLLVGVVAKDGNALYKSSRGTLARIAEPYQFVGIGKDVGFYIMKNRNEFLAKLDLRVEDWDYLVHLPAIDETVPIVKAVIEEIAQNVPNCGKGVRLLKVPIDAEPSYEPT
jgi:hypothetical protein